ncbi:unnamed protein product [Prunus brigantina]
MDHLAVGVVGSQAPASSASSVAQPISAWRRHRPASTTGTTSTDASFNSSSFFFLIFNFCFCFCIKTEVRGQLSTNYNLEDLDDESLAYVNRLFSESYRQWKSDLHHHFEVLMIRKSLFMRVAEAA